MSENTLVKISFDGSSYAGWQIQPNAFTIQEQIQLILQKIYQQPIKIIGCSRTDAGVHADSFYFHFHAPKKNVNLQRALNSLLPQDIRVLGTKTVQKDFHARYSAKSKVYLYKIQTSQVACPFLRKTHLHYRQPLCLTKMQKASKILTGRNDFRGFSNENHRGSALNKPIKTLLPIKITAKDNTLVIRFEADGFLYKMVRNITGALLNIASNKASVDCIKQVLISRDRALCPPPAPCHGLTLHSVTWQ